MNIKIGILSDPHASPEPVREALSIFRQENVTSIFCAGDIAGYGKSASETVDLLIADGCMAVKGNHDVWYVENREDNTESCTCRYLKELPVSLNKRIAGKKLYMVHASPPNSLMDGIRLLDEQGKMVEKQRAYWAERLQTFNYDVLVVGHTHQVFAEKLADTLVINPGSTLCNHSCAVVSFPELEVRWFALSGQALLKSWNWGINWYSREGR